LTEARPSASGQRKRPFFEKSGAKTFGYAGPVAAKPARLKMTKTTFYSQKIAFSFARLRMIALTQSRFNDYRANRNNQGVVP
jgi:hypothetical protein